MDVDGGCNQLITRRQHQIAFDPMPFAYPNLTNIKVHQVHLKKQNTLTTMKHIWTIVSTSGTCKHMVQRPSDHSGYDLVVKYLLKSRIHTGTNTVYLQ
jgi:hypothetical protein